MKAPVSAIPDLLLAIEHLKLSVSSIRVHLAAISPHHLPVQDHTIFSHTTFARFLKGFIHVFPSIQKPSPSCDLNIVLIGLKGLRSSFYPLYEVTFLVAIISAWRNSRGNSDFSDWSTLHCVPYRYGHS